MHSEKRKIVLNINTSIRCQYSDNTDTQRPILFNTNTTNTNTNTTKKDDPSMPQYLQCRYRQYQYQTIPSIPIPERVGVGTRLLMLYVRWIHLDVVHSRINIKSTMHLSLTELDIFSITIGDPGRMANFE
jgi:hypothetical protein